jgi:hypothetical protein
MMHDVPFQPLTLRKKPLEETKLTLIKRVLRELTKVQSDIPQELRTFRTKDIIKLAKDMDERGEGIQRSTLGVNFEIAVAIAIARGEAPPERPDFSRYANARINMCQTARSRSRRYSYLLRNKQRDQLAQDVVGLQELLRHSIIRRKLLEEGKLDRGPWPASLPFPNDPFRPSATVDHRYQQLRTHRTKAVLAREIVSLEKPIAEHRAHIQTLDRLYLEQKRKQTTARGAARKTGTNSSNSKAKVAQPARPPSRRKTQE